MSDLFSEARGPQEPQRLTSPIEISSHLRMLLQYRAPLEIKFAGRQQIYQSYIVDVDRQNNRVAFDELIPNNGEQLLLNGETFKVVAYRQGVRITWSHSQPALPDSLDNAPCYWLTLPEEMSYHQRRNAFRAQTLPEQSLKVTINSSKLSEPVTGRLLNISATGCKVVIKTLDTPLEPGQLYESCTISLPAGRVKVSAELRHQYIDESSNTVACGFRFHDLQGAQQRTIERFVYQLQREARRSEESSFF